MRIYCTENYESMSRKVAEILAAQVVTRPDSVLGLATGSTPIGAYGLLAKWCAGGSVSFAGVRTVNLDEYMGLSGRHPQSYRYFMQSKLFGLTDILTENTYLPDGTAADPAAESKRYEDLIAALGGIDLQLLGLGHNGHIGFNEPGEAYILNTHVVDLAESTIRANSRLFADASEVPRQAITVGIGCIMRSKRVLMAVSGADKAEIVRRAFTGPVTPQVPASILQLHPDVTLVGDQAALSKLMEGGVAP